MHIDGIHITDFYKRFYNADFHVPIEKALARIEAGAEPIKAIRRDYVGPKKAEPKSEPKAESVLKPKKKEARDKRKAEYNAKIRRELGKLDINQLKEVLAFVRNQLDFKQ